MPWPSSAVNSGPRRLLQARGVTETRRNSQPTCSTAFCLSPVGRPDLQNQAEHLSVYQTFPELWEREAFEEKLDGAPEATGEPGKPSAGELGRLAVRVFFSAGAGLLAWSHMPVETAQ